MKSRHTPRGGDRKASAAQPDSRSRSATPTASATDGLKLRVGDRLGPYILCHRLGQGGMATVFLARTAHARGRRQLVAIKCLQPCLCNDDDFVAMFLDEAAIASRIRHPNVCAVHDLDVYKGQHYLVMETLMGSTLRSIRHRLADGGPIDLPTIGILSYLVANAAEGLHAAHELRDVQGQLLNVVHRDVSPENLLVTYDGILKVVDFGVAAAAQKQHETRAGVVKGKFAYLAPELLAGVRPDRRADVWGLGAVMWELLTGEQLFRRDTDGATLQAVSHMPIPPPSHRNRNVPRELDQIVLKALSRNRAKRYDTIRKMGQALTRFNAENKLAVGLAEVALFMERTFPKGREEAHSILATAATAFPEKTMVLDESAVEFLANASTQRKERQLRPRNHQSKENVNAESDTRSLRPTAKHDDSDVPRIVARPASGPSSRAASNMRLWAVWLSSGVAITISLVSLIWQAAGSSNDRRPGSHANLSSKQFVDRAHAHAADGSGEGVGAGVDEGVMGGFSPIATPQCQIGPGTELQARPALRREPMRAPMERGLGFGGFR